MLEGRVVEGGTEDLSDDEDDDDDAAEETTATPSCNGGFGGGWITPKNIASMKRDGTGDEEMSEPVKVRRLMK